MSTDTTTQTETYAIDATHSTVEFVVRHLMISKVRGRFATVAGTITTEAGNDVPVAVDVTIEAKSVDTREGQRDDHLRSADFLHSDEHPHLTYKSTRIEGTPGSFKVYGNLTLRGTTREVVLDGTFEGRGADPWGNQRIGYSAHTTINRSEFGVSFNQALETGGFVVSDEVKIELNVEGIRQ
jgi:polyisoprenoid-binding protein YceI